MSLNNYLRKFSRTFFKDASVSDTGQVVAGSATVTVYRQGATVSDGIITVTTSPTVINVYDSGRVIVGDTLQAGTDTSKQMVVTAVSAQTITAQSTVGGSFALTVGNRLIPYGSLPTLYSESTGVTTTANPTSTNSRGLAEFYVREMMVDVILSGSGLTTTLYQNEDTGVIHRANVRDYGATGDGSTDDTAAIALALASVPTTGGDVYFPPGTYRISSSLTPQSKTCIHGDGAASLITDITGNMNMIDITNVDDIVITNIGLQGFTVFSIGSRGAIYSGNGGSERVRIQNVYITGAGTCGISLEDSNDIEIIGCTIRNSIEHGILFTEVTRATIVGNTIVSSGAIGSSSQAGIYLASACTRIAVDANVVDICEHVGIRVSSTTMSVISNNIIRAAPTGILVEASSWNHIHGNQVMSSITTGISLISSSDQNRVSENLMTGSGLDINIASGVTDTQVLNNSIVSAGMTDAGTRTTKAGNKTTLANGYYFLQSDLNLASGQVVRVDGTQVLAAQGAVIATVVTAASSTTWGTTINTIISRLRDHGIIAT